MYERILLALDASERRRRLVSAAAALADRTHAEVLVFHVRAAAGLGGAEDVAEAARAQLEPAGARAHALTAVGDRRHVAAAIARAADAFDADLIVMGSRGLGELRALLAGSVSRAVITGTDRPLLLISHEHVAAHPLAGARVVLAPVAGAEDLEPLVLALRGLGGVGEVIVLHVSQVTAPYGWAPGYVEAAEEAASVVQAAERRLEREGYRVWTRLSQCVGPSVGHTIAEQAREVGADLIVVGSCRPRGVEGVLLGSTARAVLHHSDRPVLIAAHLPQAEKVP